MKTHHKLLLTIILISLAAALSASDYYTGRGKEDKSFFMLEPVIENVDSSERAWLPSAITSPLKANLKLFTGMTPVNLENTAKIQEIQKKVESGAYDASRAVIEAGKLQDADYGVFITVTKSTDRYQLAVSITNLTTGREEATAVISNIYKATDLQEAAINAITIKLAQQLGVNLTALGLYTLSSSSDGSLDEQLTLARQEAASYQSTIDQLNRELAGLNTASALTDQEALARKAAAETEIQLYEQRQQAAQLKAQRLLEQKQREAEEALAATARSAEAAQKLSQLSAQAEEIASQIREKQIQTLTAEERITLIENKKAAYMQLYTQVEDEAESYRELAFEEYQKGFQNPYDPANYPPAFCQNGIMNVDYQNMLILQNEELKRQCDEEAEENIAKIREATEETLSELLKDIKRDVTNLAKSTFTLSSLEIPDIFHVSSYDVNSYSWNGTLVFYMFNDSCPVTDFSLSYQDVTGEPLPQLTTKAAFEEYAATYDIYDAMFRMGTPFLTLEMDYTIVSDDDDHPSCYIISPKEYRLIQTSSGKMLSSRKIQDEDMELQYYPLTDMRGIGQTVAVNDMREEEKKQEAKEQRIAEREARYEMQPVLGMGPGMWILGTMSSGSVSGTGFDFGLDLKFPDFGLNAGMHTIPSAEPELVFVFDLGFAIDREFNLLGKKSYWFLGGQVGPIFDMNQEKDNSGNSSGSGYGYGYGSNSTNNDNYCTGGSITLNAGLLIPLSLRTALKTQYSGNLLIEEDDVTWCNRFSIGISLYLIEGMTSDEFWMY